MIPITQLVNRDGFGEWLNANGLVGTGIEIGVYHGEYSRHLLRTWAGEHLVGVDPYLRLPTSEYHDGCNVPDIEQIRDRVIAEFAGEKRYRLILKRSLEAVEQFADGSLDFVYLDGNHSWVAAFSDMQAWWFKVKQGGVLCGHDAYQRSDAYQEADVFGALWDFCHQRGLRPCLKNCTSWFIVK
jgi:hypothetical protein